jgi:hypothetical protein
MAGLMQPGADATLRQDWPAAGKPFLVRSTINGEQACGIPPRPAVVVVVPGCEYGARICDLCSETMWG